MQKEYYFRFREVNEEDGSYYETDVAYPTLMKKHIQKHGTVLQPIYEAISNSFEATKDENDAIMIAMNFSHAGVGGVRDLLSVAIQDTGHGITSKDLIRLQNLYDESKGYNNLGSGRVQYLHFFNRTDIHTIYKEAGKTYSRRFVMSLNFFDRHHSVLWMGNPQEIEEGTPTGTTVTFSLTREEKDKKEYNELTSEKLKDAVWNHYLGRLCLHVPHCPTIFFREFVMEVEDESAALSIVNDDIPKHEYSIPYKVKYTKFTRTGQYVKMSKSADFTLQSFKLPVKTQRVNEVKVMSKGEAVNGCGMKFPLIVNAPKIDDCYRLFLLSSSYFTDKDTDLRGQLNLNTADSLAKQRDLYNQEPEDVLMEDIEAETTQKISDCYDVIKYSKENAENKLKDLIERYSLDAATVNTLVKDPTVPALTVFKEVFNKQADEKAKTYDELNAVYESLVELDPTSKTFARNLQAKIKRASELIPELNKMELLNYTCKRKVVLMLIEDILNKRLIIQRNKKGKKKKDNSETMLHQILFQKKSEDTLNSNLWIINDDYIHYNGISDTELGKLQFNGKDIIRDDLTDAEEKHLNEYRKQLDKRPDILLFPQERKCVIIELKSLSVDVTKYLSQVKTYAALLREFAKEEYLIDEFYCYLIGEDFTFDEVKRADNNFQEDFSGSYLYYEKNDGVYGGPKRKNAKIRYEIYHYSTLLKKAVLRNKIFTDKVSVDPNNGGNTVIGAE